MDLLQALAIVAALLAAFGFVMSAWRRFHSGMDTVA